MAFSGFRHRRCTDYPTVRLSSSCALRVGVQVADEFREPRDGLRVAGEFDDELLLSADGAPPALVVRVVR